jgi:hypothetical protein
VWMCVCGGIPLAASLPECVCVCVCVCVACSLAARVGHDFLNRYLCVCVRVRVCFVCVCMYVFM